MYLIQEMQESYYIIISSILDLVRLSYLLFYRWENILLTCGVWCKVWSDSDIVGMFENFFIPSAKKIQNIRQWGKKVASKGWLVCERHSFLHPSDKEISKPETWLIRRTYPRCFHNYFFMGWVMKKIPHACHYNPSWL